MKIALLIAALGLTVGITVAGSQSQGQGAEFAGCTLQEVKGATLSIKSYACPNARLVADDKLPGFVLQSGGPDDTSRDKSRRVVIRTFPKFAPDASAAHPHAR